MFSLRKIIFELPSVLLVYAVNQEKKIICCRKYHCGIISTKWDTGLYINLA